MDNRKNPVISGMSSIVYICYTDWYPATECKNSGQFDFYSCHGVGDFNKIKETNNLMINYPAAHQRGRVYP